MRQKIGLHVAEDGDRELIHNLLDIMQSNIVDFTQLFRRLGSSLNAQNSGSGVRSSSLILKYSTGGMNNGVSASPARRLTLLCGSYPWIR